MMAIPYYYLLIIINSTTLSSLPPNPAGANVQFLIKLQSSPNFTEL